MIKNILFDLDGTLLDFIKAEHVAITRTFTELGIQVNDAIISRYSEINSKQWELLEKGKLTREQVLVRRFEILFEELGVKASGAETRTVYEKYLSQGHYFIEGAEKLLDDLYGKYKLYLASNGTSKVQAGRLESADISKYFDEIFISQDIGYNKPDKRYFDFCFGRIEDFKRDETVIIGDRISSDIIGGNNAGIKTIWFNPDNAEADSGVHIDCQVSELSQIPDVLLKL